jgi:hypothetical protein
MEDAAIDFNISAVTFWRNSGVFGLQIREFVGDRTVWDFCEMLYLICDSFVDSRVSCVSRDLGG